MALENDYINMVLNRFKDDDIKVLIDKFTSTKWYVGVSIFTTALKHEPKWMVFEIVNSDNTVDINSSSNLFEKIWNDRFILEYASLEKVFLSTTDISDNTVGVDIATITTLGGFTPITFSIVSQDAGDHFEIVLDKLKLKNAVLQGSTTDVTIRATDNTGMTVDILFTMTATFFTSTKSVYCNGVDQKITVAAHDELHDLSDAMSHCFWVKIPSVKAYAQILTQKYSSSGYKQLFQLDSSGAKIFIQYFGNEGVKGKISTNSIVDNQWHFIVATFKASTDELELYIDGAKDFAPNGVTAISAITTYVSSTLYLLDNLEANIDDVAIFNRLLSAAEVLDFYNEGAPKDLTNEAGLVYYAQIGDDVISNAQNAIVGVAGQLINLDENTISMDVPS